MIPTDKIVKSLRARRLHLKSKPPTCDFCSLVMETPTEVRLMDYYKYPSTWRCFGCMGRIWYEPGCNENTEEGRVPLFYERSP